MIPTTSSDVLTQPIASPIEVARSLEVDDPHARLTPEQRARFAAYMAEPKELPKSCADENGRLIPMSDEEMNERWEQSKRRLAKIDAEDDDPLDIWDRIEREMNEERALEGRGPAFPERCSWRE